LNELLFFLHPDDKQDQLKLDFDEKYLTFFQHGSKGVEGDVGMSFGLGFGSCCHVKKSIKEYWTADGSGKYVGLIGRTKGKLNDFWQ
jgi:hypothetical protein